MNKGPYTPSSPNGTLQFPDHWGGAWMWGGAFDPNSATTSSIRRIPARFTSLRISPIQSRRHSMPIRMVNRRILYSSKPEQGPIGDLVFSVLIFRQRLALLGSALGPPYRGRRQHRRYRLAGAVRHHGRNSGRDQNRSTELSWRSYDHGGRPHLHDRHTRPIFSSSGNEDRQRVVVLQNGPGSLGSSHCVYRQERKRIRRGGSR